MNYTVEYTVLGGYSYSSTTYSVRPSQPMEETMQNLEGLMNGSVHGVKIVTDGDAPYTRFIYRTHLISAKVIPDPTPEQIAKDEKTRKEQEVLEQKLQEEALRVRETAKPWYKFWR